MDYNVGQFVNIIKACCFNSPDADKVALESITQVSLLLVQFVSPDVMYNGLPWPEEEFSKVNMKIWDAAAKIDNNRTYR